MKENRTANVNLSQALYVVLSLSQHDSCFYLLPFAGLKRRSFQHESRLGFPC